ncbi:MAG TPA: ATP phosphoribosyltransferase regulatory subunit [Nitrospiria bacterium]|nr:ATP phosphoribosyltransferase regulatory subunit [Nitrospiria bacterium]
MVPKGVATFLPEGAARRRTIEKTLLTLFGQWGYQEVITPLFEYLDVLSMGVGEELLNRAFKFVDRSSGRMMVLRPDVTSQIARMAATLLSQNPLPLRLCYSANVLRHEEEHAGRDREIFQMGVECIGIEGVEADAEIVTIAIEALNRLGLKEFKIAIGHMGFFRGLLEGLEGDPAITTAVLHAVARKEQAELERLLLRAKVPPKTRSVLLELPNLFGGEEVLREANRLTRQATCQNALRQIKIIFDTIRGAGYGSALLVDLGEVRRFDYYTGMVFEIFVDGMGYELGGGGRYDQLVERFGHAVASTGFALHIERLQTFLDKNGFREDYYAADLLLAYPVSGRADALRIAQGLRREGYRVISHCGLKSIEEQILKAQQMRAKHLAVYGGQSSRNLLWIDLKSRAKSRLNSEELANALAKSR